MTSKRPRRLPSRPAPPAVSAGPLSRRDFLRGAGAGGAVLGGALLTGCGIEGTKQAGSQTKDLSSKQKVVNFSNWPLYIDKNKQGEHPTLKAFEEKTGIKVHYIEEINSNASFFAKIRPQLAAGQPCGSDIVIFTDDYAAHMIELGWTQKLDKSNIPNAENLREALASPPYDPKRQHSLPWQSGLTGIGVNTAVTGREIRTVDELLTAPDLKGKVTLLSSMSDTMSLMLLSIGANPESFTDQQFDQALEKLKKAIESGQIRQFTGNDYAPQLAKGNIAACFAWSGDVIQLRFDNPKIKFVTPESGAYLWSDNMQVPAHSPHKTNAEKLMNYYYDPMVAAKVAAWVNYITPVAGAQEAMKKVDPSLVDNELIFPTKETLSNAYSFKTIKWEKLEKLRERFNSVIGL